MRRYDAAYPMQSKSFALFSDVQHLLADHGVCLLLRVILLELPRQELPVELAWSPEQAVLQSSRQLRRINIVGCHSTSVRHALGEDAATEARVENGHGTHNTGLVGEVDVQVDTQVAARGDVILLVVLLLDCSQGAVTEERAIQ
jgi:hypothetical protein